MTATRRLPAAERRAALVEAGLRVFSAGSYAGATTADIAREAGVTEPILYRHFGSKRELWFACVDEAWERVRSPIERELARGGPAAGPVELARIRAGVRELRTQLANLWIQALGEAGEDPEIRAYLRRHVPEVHGFLAGVFREGQLAGAVAPGRDPSAEAWITLAAGLLVSVADRLGGLLTPGDLDAIADSRAAWLSGQTGP